MSKRKAQITKKARKDNAAIAILTCRRRRQVTDIANTMEPLKRTGYDFPPDYDGVVTDEQTRAAIKTIDALLLQVTQGLTTNHIGDGANVLVDALMIVLAKHDVDPVYTMIDAIADKNVKPRLVLDDMVAALNVHHGVLLNYEFDSIDGDDNEDDQDFTSVE